MANVSLGHHDSLRRPGTAGSEEEIGNGVRGSRSEGPCRLELAGANKYVLRPSLPERPCVVMVRQQDEQRAGEAGKHVCQLFARF